jgi:hypothetical protein
MFAKKPSGDKSPAAAAPQETPPEETASTKGPISWQDLVSEADQEEVEEEEISNIGLSPEVIETLSKAGEDAGKQLFKGNKGDASE